MVLRPAIVLVLLAGFPGLAVGGVIAPGDFASGTVILSFDSLVDGSFISDEFECSAGVVFSGLPPIGAAFSEDLADRFGPNEAVSPFVRIVGANPSTSTSSLPFKVISSAYSSTGVVPCDRCGIMIRFLDPLPSQVGLWISDPDAGQTAQFSGPNGFLTELVVSGGGGSNFPFFMGYEDPGGILQVVLRSQPSVGIGFDDLMIGSRASPACSAPVPEDSDSDGEANSTDDCPNTPASAAVDAAGCSVDQYCAEINIAIPRDRRVCRRSDWRNDQALGRVKDCALDRGFPGIADDLCVRHPDFVAP